MATPAPTSLTFKVQRREPELITPAESTPHELKLLSDIDDQEIFRFFIPGVLIYRHNPSMKGKDPVEVVREALSKALVFYYPFAGRIREGPGRKFSVDCTAEGVLFIEADADVTLEQFGDPLKPPIPCLEELLYDVPGSHGVLNCPLLIIQVTRLRCGGFIVAVRTNHTLCDAQGLAQFLSAVGEIARGAYAPFVLPVWERHLLGARDPPRVTREHREYDEVPSNNIVLPQPDNVVENYFFFGPSEIFSLRKLIPVPLSLYCTNFDLVAACVWRLRIIALQLDLEEETRLICAVNMRGKLETPLPTGYYGNALATPVAITTVRELCEKSLEFAVEKVRELKMKVDGEYVKSLADLMVLKGRPLLGSLERSFAVSNVTRAGFNRVDFGWGKPVYGGPTMMNVRSSHFLPFRNKKGEDGILVQIVLPVTKVERFEKELHKMLNQPPNIKSAL